MGRLRKANRTKFPPATSPIEGAMCRDTLVVERILLSEDVCDNESIFRRCHDPAMC